VLGRIARGGSSHQLHRDLCGSQRQARSGRDWLILCLSPTLTQSQVVFNQCEAFLQRSGAEIGVGYLVSLVPARSRAASTLG
jgi:hypothetical protein